MKCRKISAADNTEGKIDPAELCSTKHDKTLYFCPSCEYKSDRSYNVIRHEERIHKRLKLHVCCGISFETKGEYYLHCEIMHPNTRKNAIISKTKYKICSNNRRLIRKVFKRGAYITQQKYSRRIQEKQFSINSEITLECSVSYSEMYRENLPLVYFLSGDRLKTYFSQFRPTKSIEKMINTIENNRENLPLVYFLSNKRLNSYLNKYRSSESIHETIGTIETVEKKYYARSSEIHSVNLEKKIEDENQSDINEIKNDLSDHDLSDSELKNDLSRHDLSGSEITNDLSDHDLSSSETSTNGENMHECNMHDLLNNNYDVLKDNNAEIENNPVLPTKKLILYRFRSDTSIEIRNNYNTESEQTSENLKKNISNHTNQTIKIDSRPPIEDKENVSSEYIFDVQQLKVRVRSNVPLPVVTAIHREFLSSFDFENYKAF